MRIASAPNFVYPIAILAFALLAHFVGLYNEFVNWDDQVYVYNNPLITGLTLEHLKNIFTQPVAGNYHPLTVLSLAFNYKISGIDPFSYHLVNLILHAANSLLVFVFFSKLKGSTNLIAFVCALLFAVHPMHVESVAWVSERKDLLYSFFFLAGLIKYLDYKELNKSFLFLLVFLFFICALLSKPAAVVFPLILILLDWYQEKEFSIKSQLNKISFISLSILIGLMTLYFQSGNFNETFPFHERMVIAGFNISSYIKMAIIPTGLSAIHPFPKEILSSPVLLPFFLSILFGIGIVYSLKWNKWIFFGFGFFLINLLLVIHIIPLGDAIISERYTYLPYLGLYFIAANVFFKIISLENNFIPNKILKTIIPILFIAFLFHTCYSSYERTKVWNNSKTLWSNCINQYPNLADIAYNNRGNFFREQKQYAKAKKDYSKALTIDSTYAFPYLNLGIIADVQNEDEKALNYFTKCLKLKPASPEAFTNRGNLFIKLNENEKALNDYDNALLINPNFYDGLNSKGVYLMNQDNLSQALEFFNKALTIKPHAIESLLNRASCNYLMGNYELTKKDMHKAIELEPQNDILHFNQAIFAANKREFKSAKNFIEKTLSINTQNASYHNVAGKIYYGLHEFESSIAAFNEAIKIEAEGKFFENRALSLYSVNRLEDALNDMNKAKEMGHTINENILDRIQSKISANSLD